MELQTSKNYDIYLLSLSIVYLTQRSNKLFVFIFKNKQCITISILRTLVKILCDWLTYISYISLKTIKWKI